jgi:aminoglycoside phosphotransferase (APT) family kinase protein
LADRLEILRQFARIQRESVDKTEQLIALGLCDRRLEWMLNEIEPFLNKPKIADSVTAEEAEKLRALAQPLAALCRKLYEYGVPDTIIHGDLHGSNVARNEKEPGKLLFFDWTDAAVSHPFFDMLLIYICKDPAEQEAMRDLYLAQWLDYEPMERLLELWKMAKVVAAVYHGLSYIYIIDGLEDWAKADMDWAMPFWLRKILEYSEDVYEKK